MSTQPRTPGATFAENLVWFATLSEPQLREYLYCAIRDRSASPIELGVDVSVPYYLVQIVRSSPDSQFQARFRQAVCDLLDNTSHTDPPRFIGDLLLLLGRTGAAFARRRLLFLANRAELKDVRTSEGEDLHSRTLRVLASLTPEDAELRLFEKDLYDPRYTPVCFTALRRADLANVQAYTPALVSVSYQHPNAFPLRFIFHETIREMGVANFSRCLDLWEPRMSLEEWQWLWTALDGILHSRTDDEDMVHLSIDGLEGTWVPAFRFDAANRRHRMLVRNRARRAAHVKLIDLAGV